MRMRACGASPSAPWPFHCLVATRSRPAPSTEAAPHGMTSCCNMLQHHWLQDRAQAPMVCPFCRSKFRSFQNPAATYCLPHHVLPASTPTHQPVPPHAPHWPQEEPNPLHRKHNPPFPQIRRSPLYNRKLPTSMRCTGYQDANRASALRIYEDCVHKHHYL